jgi:hypothetical protein
MASWREGDKARNVHLGTARKMYAEAARQKAIGRGRLKFWQIFQQMYQSELFISNNHGQ